MQPVERHNGPATQATLRDPSAIAVAPDQTLFISQGASQYDTHRIRRVATDGTITTYAGAGNSSADGIQATNYYFHPYFRRIRDIALAPDGSLFVVNGL
jgi:hypothetical protein